jgi:hypothetical protein
VRFENSVNVGEAFELLSRATSSDSPQLLNVADANTITGAVTLTDADDAGPDDWTISSTSGTLTLSGGITSSLTSLTNGDRVLNLAGSGDGSVSALTFDNATGNTLNKTGTGTWQVADAAIDAGKISSQAGVLQLTGTTDLTGDMVYEVLAGAELDVTGVSGGFTVDDTQTLQGGGTVTGDVVAATGAMIAPGIGSSIATLTFSSLLDIDGTLMVDLTGTDSGSSDMIDVTTNLDITAASVDFNVLATLNDMAYIFASYGTLTGLEFASILDQPTGYSINYAYQGNQIALVRDAPAPAPAPAPLALVGLGLFLLARATRRAKG